jgi:hypothetical protein
MDQDIPGETFQEVADIAKEAVQKVDEAQNVEQLQKEVDVAEYGSQQVEAIPQTLRLQPMRFGKLMQLLKHEFRKVNAATKKWNSES